MTYGGWNAVKQNKTNQKKFNSTVTITLRVPQIYVYGEMVDFVNPTRYEKISEKMDKLKHRKRIQNNISSLKTKYFEFVIYSSSTSTRD